jgi:hypothetical protein
MQFPVDAPYSLGGREEIRSGTGVSAVSDGAEKS